MQWPSTSVCGLPIAAIIRSVIGADGIRSLECTLATTTSSWPSSSSVWSSEPSSRMSTSIPGRIRNGARVGVQLADQLQLGAEPVGGQPAGHGEPGRVVGQRHPLVPEVARGQRHLQRRAAAVGPVRVRVAVAPHRGPQRGRRGGRAAVEQPGQVLRLLAGRRLRDHLGGYLADPGQLPQRPGPHPAGQLPRAQPGDDLGGAPERPDPVRRRAGPLKLERDLPQRPRRIHACQLTNHRRRDRSGLGSVVTFPARGRRPPDARPASRSPRAGAR